MISGFLTSVINSLRPRQHIEERLTLIIDFLPSSRLLAAKRLISEPIKSSTDVADKHARYISEIFIVRRSRERSDELGDNGAHRCVDYCFCKRTAIITERHYWLRLPRCLVLPREWRPTGHVFLASSCLTPNKGICSI